jgi:mono/diheme cytochrome c family protein
MVMRAIRNIVTPCAVLVSVFTFAAAACAQNQKTAHLPGSNPISGARLYTQYCAVCHGIDLKGRGPLATELKTPPADLTSLTQRHDGKFPDAYVQDVLRNGVKKPAHGDSDMPVWGPLFESIRGTDPQLVNLRITNLVNYIKSMQGK